MEAPNAQAARAARAALAIDPSAMQPGDIVKWAAREMIALGPGLVADPTHPVGVRQLSEVLTDGHMFEGIFRPAESDDPGSRQE